MSVGALAAFLTVTSEFRIMGVGITMLAHSWLVGYTSFLGQPPLTPPFSKIPPFLVIQDVPTF